MLLLIDAGNTQLKWALAAAAQHDARYGYWLHSGCRARAELAQLAADWAGLAPARVLIANVAGADCAQQLSVQLAAAFGPALQPEWFASRAALAGVRNGYRQPQQLGCDRFAALIGAHALFPAQPLLVATCGTATTIDALQADGYFSGGLILPGLALMARALAHGTAQLPDVLADAGAAMLTRVPLLADDTAQAIRAGCVAAQAGAIEHVLAQMAPPPDGAWRLLLAGGAAPLIAAHLHLPAPFEPTLQLVDNLVLIGLQRVAHDASTSC